MDLTRIQKRKRLYMMVSGAIAIFFTGYPHVWSIYQPYVMQQAGWSQTQASMCFYLALAVFVFGNIVGGRIQDKHNPKIAAFIGGGIFAAGVLLSAVVILPSPVPMYLTYGVMQGFGQGMIYTTILSIAQKWFPDRMGFASGIIVTANGLCGFFMAPISRILLERIGLKGTFLIVGSAVAFSWILLVKYLEAPDKLNDTFEDNECAEDRKEAAACADTRAGRQYSSGEMIRTRRFYFLLAIMFFGLISYFMISPVSQTIQTEQGIPTAVAVSAVMLGSIMNAGSRLAFPTLADRIGRVPSVRIVLMITILTMAVLTVSGGYMTTLAIVVMYGCYGGIMGSFPSFTSSIFGLKHSGENYGYVMLAIVLATFGAPVISDTVMRAGKSIRSVFAIGVGCAAVALFCLYMLQKELKKSDLKMQ